MRRDVIARSVLFVSLIAGCGDDKHKPDAPPPIDAPNPDSPPDAGSAACDYTEAHDATNDYNLTTGFVAEETGITFTGTAKTICGTVNNGHYSSANGSIDIDDYRFTVTGDQDVLVSVTGAAQSISSFGIFAVDSTQKLVGSGYFVYDHGVFSAHLPAGTYEISAEAYADADLTGTVPYKIKITSDMPATRCAHLTSTANFTEANDGVTNTGNDVITVNYNNNPSYALTALTTDAPEPTGITAASGTSYRISGTSAAIAAAVDSYLDKDTYQIQTGATTDQLAIRLNWTSATTDLDLYTFNTNNVKVPISGSAKMMLGQDEFLTMAAQTNGTYWIWVGAYTSSTGLPADYDLTVCAETFTP